MAISDAYFNQAWWHSSGFVYVPQTLNGFAPSAVAVRPTPDDVKPVGGVPKSQLPVPLQFGWHIKLTGPTGISGSTTDFMV